MHIPHWLLFRNMREVMNSVRHGRKKWAYFDGRPNHLRDVAGTLRIPKALAKSWFDFIRQSTHHAADLGLRRVIPPGEVRRQPVPGCTLTALRETILLPSGLSSLHKTRIPGASFRGADQTFDAVLVLSHLWNSSYREATCSAVPCKPMQHLPNPTFDFTVD